MHIWQYRYFEFIVTAFIFKLGYFSIFNIQCTTGGYSVAKEVLHFIHTSESMFIDSRESMRLASIKTLVLNDVTHRWSRPFLLVRLS